MINEFLKYGGSEIRNKLLKIMNMIFEQELRAHIALVTRSGEPRAHKA